MGDYHVAVTDHAEAGRVERQVRQTEVSGSSPAGQPLKSLSAQAENRVVDQRIKAAVSKYRPEHVPSVSESETLCCIVRVFALRLKLHARTGGDIAKVLSSSTILRASGLEDCLCNCSHSRSGERD